MEVVNTNHMVFYPQDEMTTVLLPVTTGCNYNKCSFCAMYKDETYKEVPYSDIENNLRNGYLYTEKVFLTGADPMAIGFKRMYKILKLIKEYYPYCARVASYGSIRSIANYTVEDLSILHDEGLRLLYIGFETGRDDILKLMKKGHTASRAIEQAKKLNEADLMFDTIVMYGIAGKGQSISNAIETANMINEFRTNRVITMNLTVFSGTDLDRMIKEGEFIAADGAERLLEIKTLIENLRPNSPMIFDTSHPTNIISIRGTLPRDKDKLLKALERPNILV
ncbi:MAG: radical SAM protein [Tissierellaceae bacterium]